MDTPPLAHLRFAETLAINLRSGRSAAWFRLRSATFHGSAGQFVALSLIAFALTELEAIARIGWRQGRFTWYEVPEAAFPFVCVLVAATLAGLRVAQPGAIIARAVALAAVALYVDVFRLVCVLAVLAAGKGLHATHTIDWFALVWFFLAATRVLLGLDLGSGINERRALRVIALCAGVAIACAGIPWRPGDTQLSESLFQFDYEDSDRSAQVADERANADAVMSEEALYAQPRLLHDALAKLSPGRSGVVDLYFVAFAGYGDQDVFVREARAVEQLMTERFDASGRTVVLGNHASTVGDYPFATVTALREVLAEVGRRMNRDEDVLVLFITSHGSSQHVVSVELGDYRFKGLDPQTLRKALDDAGIVNRLLIVSACYSGGFIDPLESPTTGVITAARSDRTSFGCANDVDWTYFGRAYFADSLTTTHDFESAFAHARPLIAKRESEEHQTPPSEPQMRIGPLLHDRLLKLAARLDALETRPQ